MAKKIEIRFTKHLFESGNVNKYTIEKKTLFGFKRLGYLAGSDAGSCWMEYYSQDKNELLEKVLYKYFKTHRSLASITEYPELIKY